MAKPVKKTTVRKKRKERKNIERGQAHIQATFNNTIVTLTDMSGNALAWSSAGFPRFQGFQKIYSFRCAERCGSSCQGRYGTRPQDSRSIRKRSRFRQRSCHQSTSDGRTRNHHDQGHHTYSSQRLQTAEEKKSVITALFQKKRRNSKWQRILSLFSRERELSV